MSLLRKVVRFFANSKTRRGVKDRRHRFVPHLEGLELRALPSVAVQVFDDGVPVTMTLSNGTFSGSSAHFSVAMGTGIKVGGNSNSPGSNLSFLTSQINAQLTSTGIHTLTVEVSEIGFTAPTGTPLMLSTGSSGEVTTGPADTISATYQSVLDPTNTQFGNGAGVVMGSSPAPLATQSTPPVSGSASGAPANLTLLPPSSTNLVPSNNPFALTGVAVITFNALQTGDFLDLASTTGVGPGPQGSPPMINTSQMPATATVGTSIADKATVTGGINPTGTVTFNLYNNPNGSGTPLFTDANEPLVGGMATSVSYPATATGTDYWVATYNGDNLNPPVSSGTMAEPVVITPATPKINTMQQPASATVGTSIADKATVSGGFNPTGTVTFNLYNNPNGTGTPLFTSANVPLVGGMATSAGYTATATGTDYWVATYNGDSNNASVSSGTAAEPVVISPATPVINTSQQPATAPVGTSIADKATVSGGFNPTGTVTFNLYNNPNGTGTPLFTDANEPLVGGMVTSKGYTPPAQSTDYWVATYNGDSNNISVSSGTALEPVVITKNGNSGTGIITGTKYLDATGNGFCGTDTPLGGVTINLYMDKNANGALDSGDGAPVAMTVTATNGTYSFTNLSPGTYFVQEVVQSGYVQTGGGPNGTPGNTYYTVCVQNGHTYSGNNFDDFQVPTCTPTNVSFTVNNNNCFTTVSDLRGNTQQGDTVTVTFTVPAGMNDQLSLVSYIAPGPSFDASTAHLQQIFDLATGIFTPGTHSLTVLIPNCYYQIDFVCGQAINVLGPCNYGPDSSNIFYSAQSRLISADNGGTQACSSKPVAWGNFGTTALWSSSKGQNLLRKLNGSSSATNLAQWLVTTFGNLYGSGAGSHSLVNSNGSYFTNSQVASAYSLFTNGDQQVLSAALSVYATSINFAGASAANYASNTVGLITSLAGSGMETYNVGANGASFGVANNTTWTVMQLLVYLNGNTSPGAAVSSGANSVFTGIDTTGNVK